MRFAPYAVMLVVTLRSASALAAPTETIVATDVDDGIPSPRYGALLAFDEVTGTSLMYGKNFGFDTWLWDGTRWKNAHPVHSPTINGNMASDTSRQRIVLTDTNQTWEWDGADWTAVTSVHLPQSDTTLGRQMFFDSKLSRTILFASYATKFHTWAWDGSDWTDLAPAHSPDAASCAGYDVDRQRGVLIEMTNLGASQTWEWDGSDWTQITPSADIVARTDCRMVYDEAQKRSVVYGGTNSHNGTIYDQWSWDGSAWTEFSGVQPYPREDAAFGYDKACACDLMFGGVAISGYLASTWEFTSGGWSDHSVFDRPPLSMGLPGGGFLYDAKGTRNLYFTTGDWRDVTPPVPSTWAWNGNAWAQIVTAHDPPFNTGFVLTFDRGNANAVLFGGQSNQTWLFDGTDWTQAAPATSPPALEYAAAAYDIGRKVTVVFGGLGQTYFSDDTWEWDGSNWMLASPTKKPPGRKSALMAFDAAHQEIVLYGGGNANGNLYDTWTYDGKTWTQHNAICGAQFGSLVYDSARKRVLGIGQVVWEWDGSTWSQLGSLTASPTATPAAYDESRGRVIFFNGLSALTHGDQTTELFVRGGTCVTNADCDTGICEDGTCCTTACGGSGDCKVCSVAAGGTDDGLCVIASAGSTCRGAAGACDVPETCDGASPSCPPDGLAPGGTSCSAALCANGIATAGATCTGLSPDCPLAASSSCDPYVCSGDGGCLASCTTNADCVAGFECSVGKCGLAEAGADDAAADAEGGDGADASDTGVGDPRVIGGCACSTARARATGGTGRPWVAAVAIALAVLARRRPRELTGPRASRSSSARRSPSSRRKADRTERSMT